MKKIRFWLVLVGVFLMSALASYYILNAGGKKPEPEKEHEQPSVGYENLDEDKRVNFLLLGYGGAGHDGGFLSDVIMVVSVDPFNKQVSLISIPRDLWVTIPIQSDKKLNFKINAAYAIGNDDKKYPLKEPQYKGEFGGGNLSVKVVGDSLGLKIKNFAAVDFSSFENIIDLLGGIEVNVSKTFDDYFYPIKGLENETCGFSGDMITEFHQKYSGFELEKQFTCRYEHLHFDKGSIKMDGKTALKFVRSRHSAEYGGDFARGERQNSVLFAAKDKLLSIYAAKNAEEIYRQFQNSVKTDVNFDLFGSLVQAIGDPSGYKIKHFGLTEDNVLMSSRSANGQFILVPKAGENEWDQVQKFVLDQVTSN